MAANKDNNTAAVAVPRLLTGVATASTTRIVSRGIACAFRNMVYNSPGTNGTSFNALCIVAPKTAANKGNVSLCGSMF